MGISLLAIGLVAQLLVSQNVPNTSLDVLEKLAETEKQNDIERRTNFVDGKFQKQKFVESFNALAKAMGAFSAKYQTEHVIDVKAVASIKKAYRKLEDTEPWFKVKRTTH